MNKFKKILLGTLSVLTLGLFTFTGAKVNAADEGVSYYYWKNSTEVKLLGDDGTTKIDISGDASSSTSFSSGRNLTITDSLIPNGSECSNADRKLVIGSNKSATFTMTSNFYFNMNTFYDSSDARTITIKKGTETYKTFTATGGSKCCHLVQYSDPFPAGTYTITGVKQQYIPELYFPLAGDIYFVEYNSSYAAPTNQYVESFDSTNLPTLEASGYIFDGWYYDSEYTKPVSIGAVDSTKASEGTISLYAKWNTTTSYTISYTLGDSATNEDGAPTSANSGNSIVLPTPRRTNYVFTGWTVEGDTNVYNAGDSYVVNDDVNFVANWRQTEIGTAKSARVDECGYIASETINSAIDGTVFTIKNIATSSESSANYNYSLSLKMDKQNAFSISAPTKVIGVHIVSTYGATITLKARTTSNGTAREMRCYNSSGELVSTNNTSTDGKNFNDITFVVESAGDYYIASYSGNTYIAELSISDNPNIRVFQQEATGQKIGEADATYIRFIAIVKADDINSSDFTFKIYRTKDSTTQSITRNVSTYNSLKLGGNDYSATLPTAVSTHTFDGNNGTEVYAVFVIGLTDADYSGYTVSAGFTFGGVEYKTSGYTFA